MKFLLLLAGVLCVTLIVSARPTEDDTETDSSLGPEDTDDSESTDGSAEGEEDTGSEAGESRGDGDAEDSDSAEGTGDGEASENGDDAGSTGEGEGESDGQGGDTSDDDGGAGGGKESRRDTYRQVHKLLKKIMKVDIKDKYLKSYVVAHLQERLMNPTIDLVGTIDKYSKIKSCFNSLEKDVQGLVKESQKSYDECKKEKSNGDCGNEGTRELDEELINREQELADCIVDKRDSD